MKKWLFVSALLIGLNALAQRQNEHWFFGGNIYFHFPSGAPPVVNAGALGTDEGSSAISDASGNLLFFTDGDNVWDRNQVLMPNGTGLGGDPSSTQSAIIVQKPGSANLFYIFTVDASGTGGTDGLRYSVVDMTLNAGFGDVIPSQKNVLLFASSTEKIAATRHCNGTDIWIASHDLGSNQFRTYLLSAAGVSAPVISSVGPVFSTAGTNPGIGSMKFSPNGKKAAICETFAPVQMLLLDFNRTTGLFTNPINLLGSLDEIYGLEFSPDNSLLYASAQDMLIWQWNLCAGGGTSAAIQASVTQVSIPGPNEIGNSGQLQLAPDNKIYYSKTRSDSVGVINNPNVLGMGCNFNYNAINVAHLGAQPNFGLPSLLYFNPPLDPFTYTISCLDYTFTPPQILTCQGITNTITSYTWNFGDPATGAANTSTLSNPVHTFSANGTYTVTLSVSTGCEFRSVSASIVVNCLVLPIKLNGLKTFCDGPNLCISFTFPETETPPFKFEIHRSGDGNQFEKSGEILYSEGVQNKYKFTDQQARQGTNYYRVGYFDNNGKWFQSDITSAVKDCGKGLFTNPNPFNSRFQISAEGELVYVKIIDQLGRQVDFEINGNEISIKELSNGVYLLLVGTTEGEYSQRIIKLD